MFREQPILECVPNFSEGRDPALLKAIATAIDSVEGAYLLHQDQGYDAHRTVMTFAGQPQAVVEAAFQAIAVATQHIDMTTHRGEHPRLGATDVCPLIPVKGISMEQVNQLVQQLAKRVAEELTLPVYLYEESATQTYRKNLANIRKGEFEGLAHKMTTTKWVPDLGPNHPHPTAGAVVMGARPFLLAYNINLNTTSVKMAQQIAANIRESGQWITQSDGTKTRHPGLLPNLKAIGWYMQEYQRAQVSMNLTNYQITNFHHAYLACQEEAQKAGTEIDGSELIGMVPLDAITRTGRFFGHKQMTDEEAIQQAITSLGLQAVKPFQPQKQILDYVLDQKMKPKP